MLFSHVRFTPPHSKESSPVLTLLVVVALNLCLVTTAHAADYYVATTGNDSNAGSEAAPFRTIAYAVSKMVAGDTTYVKGGTYNEGKISFKRSGTESAPIKLLNASGESPVIEASPHNSGVGISIINAGGVNKSIGWIIIEGFEITKFQHAILYRSAHDITIRRNWIHDISGRPDNLENLHSQGITGSGLRVVVDRNRVERVGNFGGCINDPTHCNKDHGIYSNGSDYVITNNIFSNNLCQGVQVNGSPSSAYNPEKFAGPEFSGAANWFIANNTFAYSNSCPGVVLWGELASNAQIINNIFYENGIVKDTSKAQGVYFTGDAKGAKIRHNIFYASGTGSTKPIDGNTNNKGAEPVEGVNYEQSGNFFNTANPNFEGAGATLSGVPNFKLQTGSPAIDKGQSLSQVTWDHQGIKRPAGAGFEIGAYEFCPPSTVCEQGSPPPSPTGSGGFILGPPILKGPNGEVCPSGF